MERREFLRRAAVAAGAVVVGSKAQGALAAEPKLERRNEQAGMDYVRLGRTNLMVSRITHGSLHTDQSKIPLLARLFEGGINLYDNSHVYGGGRSEEAFGEYFSGDGRRQKVFLCTKMDLRAQIKAGKDTYPKAVQMTEAALRRLRTDYVDIMMLHGCTTLIEYVNNEEWLRAAEDLKKQGKIRFVGISEHQKPVEVLQAAIASGRYDAVMISIAPASAEQGREALEAAKKADVGVLAIKTAANANAIAAQSNDAKLKKQGFSPHQLCYRYVLDLPAVASVVCGMTNMSHVDENLKVPRIQLAAGEAEELRRLAAASGVCRFCGTCLDACPNRIAVQDVLRFNTYYLNGYREHARAAYAALAPEQRASACRDCGACEAACPGRVLIRQRLREAHARLA